ncbi:putative glucan 1,3-beta-glucosidase [Planoprotostelium fungivorum]|uniref:glucan 1,3-beta-glucosidase n=1 Tax=Planoprotostelium fungivorum TaxID=1890364 RepID=A0A2P6MZC5_9EUKA|nr:putative glucan 1,3-beta-glucosidase [Planoprotostelium fungivorum]
MVVAFSTVEFGQSCSIHKGALSVSTLSFSPIFRVHHASHSHIPFSVKDMVLVTTLSQQVTCELLLLFLWLRLDHLVFLKHNVATSRRAEVLKPPLMSDVRRTQVSAGGSRSSAAMNSLFTMAVTAQALLLLLCFGMVASQNACQTARLNNLMSGQSKPFGVNLGSWFVLESWMSPLPWSQNGCSTSQYPGSYLLEQCLKFWGKRQSVMNNHWNTFITEADFAKMSTNGINFVRLPVGWWHIYDAQGGVATAKLNNSVSPVDYQFGGLAYIDKAFAWGAKYGIGILLCMHAAPGSQGGTDNSSPPNNSGAYYWDAYQNNQDATVDSIALYAKRYANSTALWGISLLNEPRGSLTSLTRYYLNAYAAVRKFVPTKPIVLNPRIVPFESAMEPIWTSFMQGSQYTNVWFDLHLYSCFGGPADKNNSVDAINYIKTERVSQIQAYRAAQPNKKLLIGEWSGANNFGDNNVIGFVDAQTAVYAAADAWSFWSWKGSGGGWNLQAGLYAGMNTTLFSKC